MAMPIGEGRLGQFARSQIAAARQDPRLGRLRGASVADLGRHHPEGSVQLHAALVRAVEQALDQRVVNTARLQLLAERINDLARSNREVSHATMLQRSETKPLRAVPGAARAQES